MNKFPNEEYLHHKRKHDKDEKDLNIHSPIIIKNEIGNNEDIINNLLNEKKNNDLKAKYISKKVYKYGDLDGESNIKEEDGSALNTDTKINDNKENDKSNKNYFNKQTQYDNSQKPNYFHGLPIDNHYSEILSKIGKNKVTIISGETGCGKTTRVPLYLYDSCLSQGNDTKILVTQPRRLAAISISKRIKTEIHKINPNLDYKTVGYQVGMENNFDSIKTKILIVTTGIFLQRLINEKNINEFPYIIIDEVHERDCDIDFVLIILKHYLLSSSSKLILMSATISTKIFSHYFSMKEMENIKFSFFYKSNQYKEISKLKNSQLDEFGFYIKNESNQETNGDYTSNYCLNLYSNDQSNPAEIINIYDRLYEVNVFYLENILKNLEKFSENLRIKSMKPYSSKVNPSIDDDKYIICTEIIRQIIRLKFGNCNGSVLVFLPGYYEIITMHETLVNELGKDLEYIEILHLHSTLSE